MGKNIKKVKLKYLLINANVENDKSYQWDKLYKSIEDNGFDAKKYGKINTINIYKHYYLVIDGHHRLLTLKKLYGEDYEIDVSVDNIFIYLIFIPLFFTIYFPIFFIYKFISVFIKYHSGKLVK